MRNVPCGLVVNRNVLVKYCKLLASDLMLQIIKPFIEVNSAFIVKKKKEIITMCGING